eukprot:TRINITY_DN13390_c0_g1_i2.p1 TRINITY_DN13390_c0_g1~~TRINITY_DN13390_c0_g1_i2.p1  ORF type:complete len:343 (-),score=62.83 TRINITY_DN13390_c0_g1_i2:147-1175(-)
MQKTPQNTPKLKSKPMILSVTSTHILAHTTKNKKKYKNQPQLVKYMIPILFLMAGFILSMQITEYVTYKVYRNRFKNIVLVFDNILKVVAPLYAIINAARYLPCMFRQYVWNPEKLMRGMLPYDYFLYLMNNTNAHIRKFETYREIMEPIVDSAQLEKVDAIFLGDLCPMISYFESLEACYELTLNFGRQGVIIGIIRYMSMIKEDLQNYEYNKLTDPEHISKYKFFNSLLSLKACKHLLLPVAVIGSHIIRPLLGGMRDLIVDGIEATCNDVSNTCLGLLIGYLIGLGLLMLFAWQPFLNYLRKSDTQAKKMLAIPPLGLIIKIRSFLNYIEKGILPGDRS